MRISNIVDTTCWQNVFVTQLSSNAGISDELRGLQQIAISCFIDEHTFNQDMVGPAAATIDC